MQATVSCVVLGAAVEAQRLLTVEGRAVIARGCCCLPRVWPRGSLHQRAGRCFVSRCARRAG